MKSLNSPQDWLGPTDAVRNSSPDALVRNAGTIYLFCPITKRAKEWIAENVQPDAQWLGHALAVEARYALPVAQGMVDDGLELK